MSLPFLLEIGSEEIPDWMIPPALESLRELFAAVLRENNLSGQVTSTDATPRRLVLRAAGLPERQADAEELVSGPPKSAGAGAATGFARKVGVTVEELETQSTAKGEYFAYRRKVAGRATVDILSAALPELILKISFPKTMYWTGKGGPRFIRPIRWMVALLGEKVVPFEVAGVKSTNTTRGHRLLGESSIHVTVDNYDERLAKNGVIVAADKRRERILAGIKVRVKPDPALIETLVHITEFPTPVTGEFAREYLELPEEVLVTVMRHHQKYLSVVDEQGRLEPRFVAVMNIDSDPEGLVCKGNERVLRARFNDARFFWSVDQKRKLAERVDGLANVTFQAKLGSYLEKTSRVVELVRELGGNAAAERAALLAKTDLTTEMVKEFTELQGVIGGLYARAQGEAEEVVQAIYEHYRPESMEDPIPSTDTGRIVALADKLDTLRGCFAVGLMPSGSRDPFALRRAAQGVVRILIEGAVRIPFDSLAAGDAQLREFLIERVRYYFREVRGFRYDEVSAVLSAGAPDLVDAEQRLTALQAVRPTENFEPLAASFKRIQNILKQAQFSGGGSVDPALLEPGPERDLHADYERVRSLVREAPDYRASLEIIASLRPKVDLFFDKVLVNAPDTGVRHNRLTLLHSLLTEFSSIADFSEIVTN